MTDKLALKKVGQLMNDLNYHYQIVPIHLLGEVEGELTARFNEGCFDKEFYQERLTSFTFHPPQKTGEMKSILIIAMPQPIVNVIFEFNAKEHLVRIPPTYDTRVNAEIQHLLQQILQPEGHAIIPANLPLKLLAARSGLVKYGRNNIGYVPGMGSFHRLAAFYTGLSCSQEHWDKPGLLERCNTCKTCIAKCPTHAISTDRFLLRAERCLTFHNEHAKDIPEYVDRSWHHCLLGCLICQICCPENKAIINLSEEREHFSEEETTLLLDGTPLNKVPASTRNKLENLSLIDDYNLIARNLGLIISSAEIQAFTK